MSLLLVVGQLCCVGKIEFCGCQVQSDNQKDILFFSKIAQLTYVGKGVKCKVARLRSWLSRVRYTGHKTV